MTIQSLAWDVISLTIIFMCLVLMVIAVVAVIKTIKEHW